MAQNWVVGLTGGIGSGKSLVTDCFSALGIDVIDADVIARQVVEPGSDGLARIASRFGDPVLHPDGTLNRQALREIVFHNPDQKQWLDALLHPLIRESMNSAIRASTSAYAVLAVPLLIENNLTAMADRVLVIDCPEDLQLKRAMQRDGSSEQTIRNIMQAQASRATRLAHADDIIDNSGTREATRHHVANLHTRYLSMASSAN
ncbi:dephospho-CoA kinase [Alteromonas sp. ASW11-19]|uniref:Dephospho-CoA kinase n=1 Tax=Alteromonas salexigens TaxID=2982530 RepID=A0ABT2VQG0_9ALTE|nr:dephospho-CoA kinase [Alteromonas salexigens]MCU7555545.1 dephospho-CoA kinase [Alteromonas salexigens]